MQLGLHGLHACMQTNLTHPFSSLQISISSGGISHSEKSSCADTTPASFVSLLVPKRYMDTSLVLEDRREWKPCVQTCQPQSASIDRRSSSELRLRSDQYQLDMTSSHNTF